RAVRSQGHGRGVEAGRFRVLRRRPAGVGGRQTVVQPKIGGVTAPPLGQQAERLLGASRPLQRVGGENHACRGQVRGGLFPGQPPHRLLVPPDQGRTQLPPPRLVVRQVRHTPQGGGVLLQVGLN